MLVLIVFALAVALIDMSGISLDERLDSLLYVNEEVEASYEVNDSQEENPVVESYDAPEISKQAENFKEMSPSDIVIEEDEVRKAIEKIYGGDTK